MAERSVVARLGANVTGYVNAVRVAKATTVDFSKSAIAYGQKHQAQLDELSNKAALLGTGMLALAGFAVKSAMDWETAWAGVTKTIDGTPAQLALIEQGLQDMSAVKPTSAIELAAIAESAGALGVKTEDILSFTSVMADLGQTTNLTSDEAATSIAQLMNVMQTAPEDVDNLGAALVDLGNKGASTERQIIQMAQNIAGAGAIVGLSEANVLSLGNALASSGIEAEAGGSAISNVLIDIDKAVKTSSPALTKWAEVSGQTAEQFATAWKADPASAIATFVEGLGRMNDRGEDVFTTLSDLGQSDIRVTRALLNMAASGDMLRESLANGDTAWERNTALAEEAAKRYDTTAAQTKMAWNEVKTAAVEAGDALLPVVAGIAGAVGDLAGVFSDLPGPVKAGLTSIVGIGGVGLIAAAGIAKVVTSVGNTRQAFQELGPAGGRAVGVLGKVGKAAGAAGLAMTALQIASSFRDSDVDGVGTFTKAILDLEDGTTKSKEKLDSLARAELQPLEDGIGGIAAAIAEVNSNSGGLGKLGNDIAGALSFGGFSDKQGANSIAAIDQALTSLVGSGALEQAATGFDYISERAEMVGVKGDELKQLFPEYTDALAQNEAQAKLTGKSTDDLTTSMTGLPEMTEEAAAALDKAKAATIDSAMGFLDLSKNIDDAKVSTSEWIDGLEDMADAQDAWADNVIEAMARGVDEGVIAKFEEMGPAGARMLDDLVNGSQKDIDRLNDIYGDVGATAEKLSRIKDELGGEVVTSFVVDGEKVSVAKAKKIAEQYNLTPSEVETIMKALDYTKPQIRAVMDRVAELDAVKAEPTVDIDTSQAREAASAIQGYIDSILGKTVTIKTVRSGDDAGNTARAPKERATGGAIYGPGTDTSDDIPALLSNGEHVLTAADVDRMGGQDAVYRFRQQLSAGNVMAYAAGGAVDSPAQARYDTFQDLSKSSRLDLARQQQQIRDIERSLKATETVGKGKNKSKRKVLRGLDRDIAQMELAEAKAELAQMKADNQALKAYGSPAAEKAIYDDAMQTESDTEAAAEAAENAAIEKARQVTSATDGVKSQGSIQGLTSPAAVDRYVDRMITDITGFTDVLARLKKKNAAPWLLDQMIKLGPSKSVIRLGEKYLADNAALASLNAKTSVLDQVSGSYGRMVSDERFMAAGAYDTSGTSKEVMVAVSTLDKSVFAAEVARVVRHELTTLAQGGSL